MAKPFVISISSVSGGGKTTLTNWFAEVFPNATVFYYDDYGFSGTSNFTECYIMVRNLISGTLPQLFRM
ncbi:hypothetical protein F9U64_10985 [Gracilibacillus oryzae]|uniref:Uridine kinase n=1 Tax=Gracilibacillus oryzae TaxID=1672701 RepID=A0A7C8GT74_9BACI|nr:hypothetical protein [Gracilibacillus oryzae]KAB8135785.1 hypothetical protein F9U64_10985 [Gracilibacillus oryzae]